MCCSSWGCKESDSTERLNWTEDLYMLKINCKGKTTVGKENKGINVEKIIIDFFKLKSKKEKTPQNCKAQHRGRGFNNNKECDSMYTDRYTPIIKIKTVQQK